MKNHRKTRYLLVLLPLLLVSCGNEGKRITPQEALDEIAEMNGHLESSDFSLPLDLRLSALDDKNGSKFFEDFAVYYSAHYCRSTVTISGGSTSRYLYVQGERLISARDDSGSKTYKVLATENAAKAFRSTVEDKGSFSFLWQEQIKWYYSEAKVWAQEAANNPDGNLDVSLFSKGSGSLALHGTYDTPSKGNEEFHRLDLKIENYLPVERKTVWQSENGTYTEESRIAYGVGEMTYPDLSTYTLISAD
ncbi:MAG: hypothetical protein ACI32C_04680 [Candidatus Enteromonas sp.]